jgi:hypothetical protein
MDILPDECGAAHEQVMSPSRPVAFAPGIAYRLSVTNSGLTMAKKAKKSANKTPKKNKQKKTAKKDVKAGAKTSGAKKKDGR